MAAKYIPMYTSQIILLIEEYVDYKYRQMFTYGRMNLQLIFYCFLTVVLVVGGTFYFYASSMEISAAIYFLGTVVAAIYFGFRWFTASGSTPATPGSWPPAINYCPDFLTLTKDSNGKQICIDMIGVAQGGTNTLQVSDGTQTTDVYSFDLMTTSTSRVTDLCAQAAEKGVTWEGVWDGTSCSGNTPPLPPS